MSLAFDFRFCSAFTAFAVAPLLLCPSLSALLCFKSAVTCARLLITHSSASLGLLANRWCRVRHCLYEEVVDRVRRPLTVDEVFELRLFFFVERLFVSTNRMCFVELIHQNSLDFSPSSLRQNMAHIQSFMNMLQVASLTGKMSNLWMFSQGLSTRSG